MLTAEAIDLLLGWITYNKMSVTSVQLKHRALITTADINQNINWLALRVIKIAMNKVGTVINDPNAQINGSAYGVSSLRLI